MCSLFYVFFSHFMGISDEINCGLLINWGSLLFISAFVELCCISKRKSVCIFANLYRLNWPLEDFKETNCVLFLQNSF